MPRVWGLGSPGSHARAAIYNAIAAKIMTENDIETDHLYTFALEQLEKIQIPEYVHYTAEDYKVLVDSPTRILFAVDEADSRSLVKRPPSFPVTWNVEIQENATLNVMVELYYCHTRDNALCFFKESLFTIPIRVSGDSGNREIRIVHNPLSMG